jgi:hypothetical protein
VNEEVVDFFHEVIDASFISGFGVASPAQSLIQQNRQLR